MRSEEHKKILKRRFQAMDEVEDYIIEKTENALDGCFLTNKVTPFEHRNINNIHILIQEVPKLIRDKISLVLVEKKGIKLQAVLTGKF